MNTVVWWCAMYIFCPLVASVSGQAKVRYDSGPDSLCAVFWNLENFFDWEDGGAGPADREFSEEGPRHWTRGRFYVKCHAVAKALLWLEDACGRFPDVVGVAEVENRFVPVSLAVSTALKKKNLGVVHEESPDRRGIDVGLLYDRGRWKYLSHRKVPVVFPDTSVHTRDILEVHLQRRGPPGEEWVFLINHHPSKYGGGRSDGRRRRALSTLAAVCDSLRRGGCTRLVAMGDFNTGPEDPVLDILRNAGLCRAEAGRPWAAGRKKMMEERPPVAPGSIRFNGCWETIDQFWVFPSDAETVAFPVAVPFLLEEDRAHGGRKPFRTWSGPRYKGGVSDHLPVFFRQAERP